MTCPVDSSATEPPAVAGPPATPTAHVDAPADAALGLRASDRSFLIALSALVVLLTIIDFLQLGLQGTPAVTISRLPERTFDFQIDVNRATWVEWMQLPEIGEATARQIVNDRQQRGPFRDVEDVDRVRGIGPATMQKIRPWLTLSSAPDAADQPRTPQPRQ